MFRILLVSDQPVQIVGLQSVLSAAPVSFGLDASGRDLDAVFDRIRLTNPDILMMDFWPEEDFGALMEIRNRAPHLRVVLWVQKIALEVAYQAMMLGVRGILRKTLPIELSLKCLRNVAAGELWLEQDLTAAILQAKTVALSPRQRQLLALVSEGLKNKEISAALGIAESTVRMYLSALFVKLGVKDRYELALYGMRNLSSLELASAEQSRRTPAGLDETAALPNPMNFLLSEKPPGKARWSQQMNVLPSVRKIVG